MSPVRTKLVDQVKIWLFPALVTILGTIIYREILEMRADVKQLLAQSNIDKTKIEKLEQQVQMINQALFLKKGVVAYVSPDEMRTYGKHEELYTLENNIETEN
jgi:hypothetical protein